MPFLAILAAHLDNTAFATIPLNSTNLNNNNPNNNNNNNDNVNNHNDYDDPSNRHDHRDAPKASAALFLSVVVSIFLLCILYHLFYIYIIRKSPYYYSVQSDVDPCIWHVERVVPLRERLRMIRGRPRSDSDCFRHEDLERVRRDLMVRGWRGRVNSDGTPNKNHRAMDDRCIDTSGRWGYNRDGDGCFQNDVYGPRQYVESEDTPFWRERRWGVGNGKKRDGGYGSFGSFRGGESPRGPEIPGMSSSRWPAGVMTPDFGSGHSNSGFSGMRGATGGNGGYGLHAAFSYHPSPGNTHFVTPPIRASSKILEGLNHTGLRYTTDRSAKFSDEELQDHYVGLCGGEDAALKDLEDARDQAAVEATYGSAGKGPEHAQRVIETLTSLEKKLLHAMKRRTVFAERFALKPDLIVQEVAAGSSIPSREPPPPYSDADENGLQFDDDGETRR